MLGQWGGIGFVGGGAPSWRQWEGDREAEEESMYRIRDVHTAFTFLTTTLSFLLEHGAVVPKCMEMCEPSFVLLFNTHCT